MAPIPPAQVDKLIVEEGSKTGTVKLVGNPTTFKIANNSDTGFEAMVDVRLCKGKFEERSTRHRPR